MARTRKSRLSKAAKAITSTAKHLAPTSKEAKTVARVALGAAAIAAAGVAAKKVGNTMREGKAALSLQRMAARKVSRLSPRTRRAATRAARKRAASR